MTYLESLFSLKSKTALVTGAARGNGRAIAEALLRAGASVILVDKLEQVLNETVSDFVKDGLPAIGITCDLSRPEERDILIERLPSKYHKVTILVNNAGVTRSNDLFEYTEEDWELTFQVNLKAAFELSRMFARIMKEKGGGSIINITSLNAELAFPNNPAYMATKGALKQLTKALAYDLAQYNIRVNNIGPGYMRTAMTNGSWEDPILNKQRRDRTVLGRWGKPEDLAGAVIFLCSDSASYITGQDLYIDGGWTIKGI
ncbi:MAG: glucose 1-dehydrogenase [Calditrichaeota bacterium]|nr:glucose 1-dehydrogenase [Calditrichota bacterium]